MDLFFAEFAFWLAAPTTFAPPSRANAADEPAQPLEITITNASEIGKVDKVLKIKRDDSGKMTGASVVAVA